METPLEVLSRDAEPVPGWLANYQAGAPFPRETFFLSRILYYPGSETDGHPLCVFGKSHAVHCFVYADNAFSKVDLERQLKDFGDPGHPLGYRLLSLVDVTEAELTPCGWKRHGKLPTDIDAHFFMIRPPEGPFAVFAVLERDENRGDDHGPSRLAILHVGGDGYATYDALFCQADSHTPYAVLLQNHGYGGNWNREGFGGDGMLWQLANQTGKTLPKWLFVANESTLPWPGYSIASLPSCGGMHHNPRTLFKSGKG
ncbi:MAG: hypothetical protein WCJ02_07475 [bacterium]